MCIRDSGKDNLVQTVTYQHPVDVQQPQQLSGAEHAVFTPGTGASGRTDASQMPAQALDSRRQAVGILTQRIHGTQKTLDSMRRG